MVPIRTAAHVSVILPVLLVRQLHPQANGEASVIVFDPVLHLLRKLSRRKDSFCLRLPNESPEILCLDNLGHIPTPDSITGGVGGWGGGKRGKIKMC